MPRIFNFFRVLLTFILGGISKVIMGLIVGEIIGSEGMFLLGATVSSSEFRVIGVAANKALDEVGIDSDKVSEGVGIDVNKVLDEVGIGVNNVLDGVGIDGGVKTGGIREVFVIDSGW